MKQLSPKGLRAVEEIARRTGFSRDAVTSMLVSIVNGGGGMAQFSHPEFGGSGQWMASRAIMISDMFNNALKARVSALCNELSALIRSEPDFAAAESFQSQSQGAHGNVQTGRAAGGHEDILTAIERLAGLHSRGILTEAEFSAKKAELLGQL